MAKRLLIIGGGTAALQAAKTSRCHCSDVDITLITSDSYAGYSYFESLFYLGKIKENNSSMSEVEQLYKSEYKIDFYTGNVVKQIFPDNNEVLIQAQDQEEFRLAYDKLILAFGSSPVISSLDGNRLNNIISVNSIDSLLYIYKYINGGEARKVIVVGGGFIGIKIAEMMLDNNIPATLICDGNQILPRFDRDLADTVKITMEQKGVEVLTGESVLSFIGNARGEVVEVHTPNHILECDLVVWTANMQPDTQMASMAGIAIGTTGAIAVNQYMQTNFPNIFAVGPCTEINNYITKQSVWYPTSSLNYSMGSTAGKNAVVDEIDEWDSVASTIGTETVNLFGMDIGKTGLSIHEAEIVGFDVESALISTREYLGDYMPQNYIMARLIVDKESHTLLGGQFVGTGAVSQATDIVAMGILGRQKVEHFMRTDFSRPSLFSAATASVLLTARYVVDKLNGKVEGISPSELNSLLMDDDVMIIDTRSQAEAMLGSLPGAINIPLNVFDWNINQLDRNKTIILICNSEDKSLRLYSILKENGFEKVRVLDGGMVTYPYSLV